MSQAAESSQEQSAAEAAMSCTTGPAPPTRRPCNDLSSIDIIVIGKRHSGKSTLIQNMKLDLQRHKGGPMRVKGGGYALVQLL